MMQQVFLLLKYKVKIDEKINVITKGVVQASIISSILSDIYYNFILHKATNLAIGTVIKYVNDILYITNRFLQLTKKECHDIIVFLNHQRLKITWLMMEHSCGQYCLHWP